MQEAQQSLTTEKIWRELSERLRHFIRSRVRAATDVDDILQSVFLRIHKSINTIRQGEKLESWVFQITRNAITDHYRMNRNTLAEDASKVLQVEPILQENSNSEIARCVSGLIQHLPDDQRRAVTMYELEGISQLEISARESISLSGAKSRIQRGRKNLQQLLFQCCQFHQDARGNVLEIEPLEKNCTPDCCN